MDFFQLRNQCKVFANSCRNFPLKKIGFQGSLSEEDKKNILLLIKAIIRKINIVNGAELKSIYTLLTSIRNLILKFDPGLFIFDFVDFLTDEGLWDWVETLKNKTQLSQTDLDSFSVLRNSISQFTNIDNVFSKPGQDWMENIEL